MAPADVPSAVRLCIAQHGGSAQGSEAQLITLVRERLRGAVSEDTSDQVMHLVYGLSPIVRYLQAGLPDDTFSGLDDARLGELAHDLFKVIAQRTRLVRRYAEVIDSDTLWREVERGLRRAAKRQAHHPACWSAIDRQLGTNRAACAILLWAALRSDISGVRRFCYPTLGAAGSRTRPAPSLGFDDWFRLPRYCKCILGIRP